MHKTKFYHLLLVIFLAFILTGCGEETTEEKTVPVYGYEEGKSEYVLENDLLKLTLNPETTHFTLEEKNTGKIWNSNPEDLSNETIANSSAKAALQSTLIIQYSTSTGVVTTFNNFSHSIENGLYEIEELEDGLKVRYSIGNIERVYVFPSALPESRFNEFYSLMDSKSQKKVNEYYRKYDINNLRSTDNRSELLETYPDLENECVYVLREGLQEYIKVNIESYFESAGYTYEDYELDEARYAVTRVIDKPVFNVSVVYRLEGDDFVVNVPFEEVQYKESYPITMIKILPYFGCGDAEDEGYLLVPDGNGGIIEFNNGKSTQNNFYSNVYGWDYGTTREAIVNETRANYPLFGICNNGSSVLCISEEGSAYAAVEADTAGRYHTFNYANISYTVIHGESMDVSAKSDKAVVVYEKSLPEGQLTQRYRFVQSENYTDLAFAYRDYLMEKYPQLVKNTDTDTPVTVEIVGAIEKIENRFGFPVTVSKSLTSYQEAAELLKELNDAGLKNISAKYLGWFNDGILHDVPTDVTLISELGGKKAFRSLVSTAKELGIELYLEAYVEFVYNNSLFDGFYTNRDASKFVTKELAELYDYDGVWFGLRDEDDESLRYLVKSSYTMKLIDKLIKETGKYGVSNLSFADLGSMLSGDYNPKNVVTREEAMQAQQERLAQMQSEGNGVMIYEGNAYAVPYADTILKMTLSSKKYGIVDYEVPFYTIALHGLVNYAGSPVNLAADYETNLLQSIETGAGLYFTFMDASASLLQETDYTWFYGAEYDLWKDEAAAVYAEYNEAMGGLYNQFITGYRYLTKGVTETTYEDGTRVYVNYNYTDYSADGIRVAARGYLVEKGGE